jgi:hypothetical protein
MHCSQAGGPDSGVKQQAHHHTACTTQQASAPGSKKLQTTMLLQLVWFHKNKLGSFFAAETCRIANVTVAANIKAPLSMRGYSLS